jgi:hypothetical protein
MVALARIQNGRAATRMPSLAIGPPKEALRTARRPDRHGDGPLMTAIELAELMGISANAIYLAKDRGQIPGLLRVGKRILFRRDVIVGWLAGETPPLGGEP